MYYRIVDWIPEESLVGVLVKPEDMEKGKKNTTVKEERIRETVRNHIILLQDKFQIRLLRGGKED